MLATRWDPLTEMWSDLNRMYSEMNRWLGRPVLRNGGMPTFAPAYPSVDIWQDQDNLYVEAELPGMQLDDLEIYVTGGTQLTVKGKREAPAVEKGTWHRRERAYGTFARLLSLPEPVDADKVEAELKHGVLTIRLPKLEEAKPRRIAVKAE